MRYVLYRGGVKRAFVSILYSFGRIVYNSAQEKIYLCFTKISRYALREQPDSDTPRPCAESGVHEDRMSAQSGRFPLRRKDLAADPGRRAARTARGRDQLPAARRREPDYGHARALLLAGAGPVGSAGHQLQGQRLPYDHVPPAAHEQHGRCPFCRRAGLRADLRQRRLRVLRHRGLPRHAARRDVLPDLYRGVGQRRGRADAHDGLEAFHRLRAGAASPQQGLHAFRRADRRPILYAPPSEQPRDRRQLHLDRREPRPAPLGQPPLRGPHAQGHVGQRAHRGGLRPDTDRRGVAHDLPRR